MRAARDATTAAAPRETVRPSYEFTTPTGTVQFSRRIMWFYPAPIGWARLQRLHSSGTVADYRGALSAALGQIIASHPDLHAALFRTLLSHIAFSRTIDGVESLYLTLLHSAAFHGQTALYKVGLGAWTAYGPPRATGGDLGFTLFYNVATTTFTILSQHQVAGLAIKNGNGGILARGAELGSGIAALGAGWRSGSGDDETANDARATCRDALVNAGAIVGLAASGSASAIGGNDHHVANEIVGAIIPGAPESGLSIGILLGGNDQDGFAAALCGGSVDVEALHEPASHESYGWHDEHQHHEHHEHHEHHSRVEHEVAVSVADEIHEHVTFAAAPALKPEEVEEDKEEDEEEEEDEEATAVAGDALGLISNFFATGPGTEAFLTRVAPTNFYLAGAPMVYGRDPGAVALGFLGANPYVARSFERLVGSAQRRK
ncbi:MAG TPA: hypothetical protein VFA43_05460 [Gemmatimonadaceae bacterium]|nr:hypothetical protein [Gemmatimonadaceae bacterium]